MKVLKNLISQSKKYSKSISERLEPAQSNLIHFGANFFDRISTFANIFSPRVPVGALKMKIRQNRHRRPQSIPIPRRSQILGRIGAPMCVVQAGTCKN